MALLFFYLAAAEPDQQARRRRRFVDYLNPHLHGHAWTRTKVATVGDADGNNENSGGAPPDVQELFLEQRLDHFAQSDSTELPVPTFRQRYFYSDRYVRGDQQSGSPSPSSSYAFLCMGREGPSLTKHVLVDSVHCSGDMLQLASILHDTYGLNVHLYALEHRYYGQSYPQFSDGSSPVSNENLRYLSSRQALGDMAHFVSTAIHDGGSSFSSNVKVVTFGGSYPGMLSAWARLKYPHLIFASVSNSSPVQAQLDFPEYNDRVAYDLRDEAVGGSDACFDIFSVGHAEISGMVSADGDGREKIAELFNICGGAEALSNPMNANAFLGDGVVFVPAQSNDPSCVDRMCIIEHLCASLIAAKEITGSNVEALAAIAKVQRNAGDGGDSTESDACVEVDWEQTIAYLSSDEAMEEGTRSWLWQTCTEFGFYQTCAEDSGCPYGKGHHQLSMDLEICERAFGVAKNSVWRNVQQSNEQYGGWNIDSNRILFVNGEVDPWSMLSVDLDHGRSAEMPTIWVEGASHHFWTHQVLESDGNNILEARRAIYQQTIEWLGLENKLYFDSPARVSNLRSNIVDSVQEGR